MRNLGDILEANERSIEKGRHYIIYLDGHDDNNFIGGMITHSGKYGNIAFDESYFLQTDQNGNDFKVIYDDTYLVLCQFIKPETWGPFMKVGQLSIEGIQFVDDNLKNTMIMSFDDYLKIK